MRISGWSSDVYSSDLDGRLPLRASPDGRRWPCNLPASERYPASTPAAALTQSRICGRACNWFFSHHPGSFAADIIVGRPASGNYRGSDRPGEDHERLVTRAAPSRTAAGAGIDDRRDGRSDEHTSELQSLM